MILVFPYSFARIVRAWFNTILAFYALIPSPLVFDILGHPSLPPSVFSEIDRNVRGCMLFY